MAAEARTRVKVEEISRVDKKGVVRYKDKLPYNWM